LLVSHYYKIICWAASSSRGPSFFTYPAIQQPLAASGLLVEPPIGVTPSPIVAAMAATVGGLLLLPSNTPPAPPASPGRKEVSFVEESAVWWWLARWLAATQVLFATPC